jgi:hypothetical protein
MYFEPDWAIPPDTERTNELSRRKRSKALVAVAVERKVTG